MIRCYLKGGIGDALHAISCAAGYNIRWLLRAIKRLGLKGLFARAFLLCWMPALWTRRQNQCSSLRLKQLKTAYPARLACAFSIF